MSLLLECTLHNSDLVIDLDLTKPNLAYNFVKLAKARVYSRTLLYNSCSFPPVAQFGDPSGDGTGGACIHALLDNQHYNEKRFMSSDTQNDDVIEEVSRGSVFMTELASQRNTLGSQFSIVLTSFTNPDTKTSHASTSMFRESLRVGQVVEDDGDLLGKFRELYCDDVGRPYTDVRIHRLLVIHDPYPDPEKFNKLLLQRGVDADGGSSPEYSRPVEERVEERIDASEQLLDGVNEEEIEKKEAHSRAVVLEMLGDLPSAEMKAPDNVLFVCKLHPVTEDEDLELIFSRFDPEAKAEIIRDPDTGDSLCYAFIEFTSKEQCAEAYFKMNNALVDDRRIKVDFSQSVAKEWNKYTQQYRRRPPVTAIIDTKSNHEPKKNHRLVDQQQQHRWKGRAEDTNNHHHSSSTRHKERERGKVYDNSHRYQRRGFEDDHRSESSYREKKRDEFGRERQEYRRRSSSNRDMQRGSKDERRHTNDDRIEESLSERYRSYEKDPHRRRSSSRDRSSKCDRSRSRSRTRDKRKKKRHHRSRSRDHHHRRRRSDKKSKKQRKH